MPGSARPADRLGYLGTAADPAKAGGPGPYGVTAQCTPGPCPSQAQHRSAYLPYRSFIIVSVTSTTSLYCTHTVQCETDLLWLAHSNQQGLHD